MKKLLLATTGLLALVASAPGFAADLPARPYTKAPPAIVATINDWSGFYVGFNAGGGSSRDRWNLLTNGGVAVNPALSNEGTANAGGAAVGGQIGYRYQVTNWVFGVEAQGDWSSARIPRAGAVRSAQVWNMPSLRTGQSASNTTTCSWATRISTLSPRPVSPP